MEVEHVFVKIVEMFFDGVKLFEGLAPLLLPEKGLSGFQLIPMMSVT